MTVFICVDTMGGMAFGGRRQTRDSAVIDDIFRTVGDKPLYISPFSQKMLEGYGKGERVKIKKEPLRALLADFVFIENMPLGDHIKKVNKLIIYRWSEHYPTDISIDVSPLECGFTLSEAREITGSSHEKITKETYIR